MYNGTWRHVRVIVAVMETQQCVLSVDELHLTRSPNTKMFSVSPKATEPSPCASESPAAVRNIQLLSVAMEAQQWDPFILLCNYKTYNCWVLPCKPNNEIPSYCCVITKHTTAECCHASLNNEVPSYCCVITKHTTAECCHASLTMRSLHIVV